MSSHHNQIYNMLSFQIVSIEKKKTKNKKKSIHHNGIALIKRIPFLCSQQQRKQNKHKTIITFCFG